MAASRWRQWLARGGTSLGFGLGLTLLAAVVHLLGLTERLELIVYDWYVEHFSRIPPSDRIVHIDIDDDSLERVGSWPWSRAIQADLVLILRELGAEQIVLDLMFPEPKGREVDIPGLDAYADVEGSVAQMGRLSEENFIFPDDELAGAFHQAGNVYLSFHYETDEGRKKNRQLAPELSARMADLLRREFDLDRDRIAARLQVKPAEVDAILAGVKRRVALERVRAELRDRPDASAEQVHRAISTRPFEKESADRADVIFAYLREKGIRELWSRSEPVPPGLKGRLPTAREVVPPLYKFTQGARRCGFVAFEPDFDGRTRRVPLLMEWNGALIEQLGFAAVRDVLGIRVEDLSLAANGDLLIAARGSRPAMRVPLDDRGQMLINWSVHQEKWEQCFRHVPVTQLLRIHDCRRRIRQNEIGRQILLGELVRIVGGEDGFQLYARQVN
ncbi:MAG: CHASE2 domain-containing protein, partial [Phycisphaerae bacterium]